MKRSIWVIAYVAAFFEFVIAVPSDACPDDQYESCDPVFHACVCLPKIGGDIGGAAERAKNEARGQVIGAPLEQWFIQSRNTAVGGSLVIPPNIRQALQGFSDAGAMDRVRYKIQDNGALNLAHIIEQWRLYDVQAVTLIDVIVFRGPTEANDACLWAHELVHVSQFQNWGTHDFAISYARDPNTVEDPAYAKERDCRAILMSRAFPPPPPPQWGAFCYTALGRFGPGPLQPIGAPCYITAPGGPVWGQIVY